MWNCSQNHKESRECHSAAGATCRQCLAESRAKEERRQLELELDQKREANQLAHYIKLLKLENDIEHQKRILKDQAEDGNRGALINQKMKDLAGLKEKAKILRKTSSLNGPAAILTGSAQGSAKPPAPSQVSKTSLSNHDLETSKAVDDSSNDGNDSMDWEDSKAEDEWAWLKGKRGASSEAFDALLSMTGSSSNELCNFCNCFC